MNKSVYWFMLDLLKPYKMRLIIVFGCMVIVSVFGILYPLLQREIFDQGIMMNNLQVVIRYTLLMLGLFAIEQLFTFIQFIHFEYINRQIPYKLMYKATDHSLQLKVAYHKDNNFAKIINNVYYDISNITQVVNANLLQAVVSVFKIIGGMIGLILIDWRLTIFVVAIVPFQLLIRGLIALKRRKQLTEFMEVHEKFSIWLSETFMSIELIKLWNFQKKRLQQFDIHQKAMMGVQTKMEYVDNYANLSSQTIGTIFMHGLNVLGAALILRDELTIGGLFAFTAYSIYVMQPITLLADLSYQFSSTIPAFKRFMAYFDNDTEAVHGISMLDVGDQVNSLAFEGVAFGYDHKEMILKSVDFTIQKGEKVAFVGVNGSGKSSIISLLLRFFEPAAGSIKINGVDIKEVALNEYRSLFSVMNQRSTLFDDTISNNINIAEELSTEQIHEYLALATASDFTKALPDGIDTSVGFAGTKLSGGERQKVALARTLSKKGKILILDEATASFDFKAEKRFNHYLTESELYDMVIVISHREDILKALDKIFIIDHGVITDVGTFDELLSKSDYFNAILAQGRAEQGS